MTRIGLKLSFACPPPPPSLSPNIQVPTCIPARAPKGPEPEVTEVTGWTAVTSVPSLHYDSCTIPIEGPTDPGRFRGLPPPRPPLPPKAYGPKGIPSKRDPTKNPAGKISALLWKASLSVLRERSGNPAGQILVLGLGLGGAVRCGAVRCGAVRCGAVPTAFLLASAGALNLET